MGQAVCTGRNRLGRVAVQVSQPHRVAFPPGLAESRPTAFGQIAPILAVPVVRYSCRKGTLSRSGHRLETLVED